MVGPLRGPKAHAYVAKAMRPIGSQIRFTESTLIQLKTQRQADYRN